MFEVARKYHITSQNNNNFGLTKAGTAQAVYGGGKTNERTFKVFVVFFCYFSCIQMCIFVKREAKRKEVKLCTQTYSLVYFSVAIGQEYEQTCMYACTAPLIFSVTPCSTTDIILAPYRIHFCNSAAAAAQASKQHQQTQTQFYFITSFLFLFRLLLFCTSLRLSENNFCFIYF